MENTKRTDCGKGFRGNQEFKIASVVVESPGIESKSLPCWLSGRESAFRAGDVGSIPGSGRSLEGGNATHSSVFAWEIPWTEEPGRPHSLRSQRVRYNLAAKQHR